MPQKIDMLLRYDVEKVACCGLVQGQGKDDPVMARGTDTVDTIVTTDLVTGARWVRCLKIRNGLCKVYENQPVAERVPCCRA